MVWTRPGLLPATHVSPAPRPPARRPVHYVQSSVEGGAAEALLGRPWLERHKDAVEDWGARYQDVTWGPVLALVQVQWGLGCAACCARGSTPQPTCCLRVQSQGPVSFGFTELGRLMAGA